MPEKTEVIFYAECQIAPVLDWLAEQPPKVQDKLRFLVALLEQKGSALSRPYAAPLRNKIYELRIDHQNVNYRVLYFFHGRAVAVLTHGCTKEGEVDDADINRAIKRREKFIADPEGHTYQNPDG